MTWRSRGGFETIKEGVTVFELTPDEARRAARMARPDRTGESAFGRFVVAASAADTHHHDSGPNHVGACACGILSRMSAANLAGSPPVAN